MEVIDGKMKVYLVRHAQTKWNITGQHTSYTDLPLDATGESQAKALRVKLKGKIFSHVFSSGFERTIQTCSYAGFGDQMEIMEDLSEWNYGEFEGKTTLEIRKKIPSWRVFIHGAKGGEFVAEADFRAKKLIQNLRKLKGDILLFSHGHISRVIGACWIGLTAKEGALIASTNASVSTLGYEGEEPVIQVWNDHSHLS